MLKEQVAEILNDIPCKKYKCDFWDVQGNYCYANSADKNASYNCPMAEAVLNLLKAELDKLTVIDPFDCINFKDVAIQQWLHTKKQLLDSMK